MLTAPKPYINEKETPKQGDYSSSQTLIENTDAWISFLTPKNKPETPTKPEFPISGTIEFKWVERESKIEEQNIELDPVETNLPEPVKEESSTIAKSSAETLFSSISKLTKLVWFLFKGVFEGFQGVGKHATERVLTPQEQKLKAEKEKKERERKENIKAFYTDLKSSLAKFNEQKYKSRLENRQRLNISDLDINTTNKLLSGEGGPMRNLSDQDVSYDYHDEHTAIALVEKRRADQEKHSKKEMVSPSKKMSAKGPRLIMEMDKQHLSKGGTVTTAGG